MLYFIANGCIKKYTSKHTKRQRNICSTQLQQINIKQTSCQTTSCRQESSFLKQWCGNWANQHVLVLITSLSTPRSPIPRRSRENARNERIACQPRRRLAESELFMSHKSESRESTTPATQISSTIYWNVRLTEAGQSLYLPHHPPPHQSGYVVSALRSGLASSYRDSTGF